MEDEITMVGMAIDRFGKPVTISDSNSIPEGVTYIKSFIKDSSNKEFYWAVCDGNKFITYYNRDTKSLGFVLDTDFAIEMGFSDLGDFMNSDMLIDIVNEKGGRVFFDEEVECWLLQEDKNKGLN